MVKIIAPEKNYKGVTSGIVFVNGIATAEIDAFTKDWFISKGYTLEELEFTPTPTGEQNEDPEAGTTNNVVEKPITKAELIEKAKALGIEVKSKATNADIQKLIDAKEAELEAEAKKLAAINATENSGNVDPEAGEQNEDPEAGKQGNEGSEGGE